MLAVAERPLLAWQRHTCLALGRQSYEAKRPLWLVCGDARVPLLLRCADVGPERELNPPLVGQPRREVTYPPLRNLLQVRH